MAELFGCERVNEIMTRILSTLQEYEKQTDSMINAELEIIQQGLIARNELIDTLEDLKEDLDAVVECEAPEEQTLLKALINGSYVSITLDKQKIGYYNSAVVGRATGQSLNKNL